MAKRVASGVFLVSRLQNEIDRALARAGEIAEGEPQSGELAPPMDVIETARQVVIVLEAPGLEPADLEIETSGNHLTIRGRRRPAAPEEGPIRFFCMECRHGEFERGLELVGALDTHRARARLARGLLRIEIPKIDDRRQTPRRIEIETEDRS